jgi:hypothetical protein
VTETLRKAVDRLEHLPPAAQDAIAEVIERELADRNWDALFTSPASEHFPERLPADARREDAAGLTHESTNRW